MVINRFNNRRIQVSDSYSMPEEIQRYIAGGSRGSLYLTYCTDENPFPENFVVNGNLFITGCHALKTLPKGLKVKGSLIVEDCLNFESIPENIQVGMSLRLMNCVGFTTLPRKHKMKDPSK